METSANGEGTDIAEPSTREESGSDSVAVGAIADGSADDDAATAKPVCSTASEVSSNMASNGTKVSHDAASSQIGTATVDPVHSVVAESVLEGPKIPATAVGVEQTLQQPRNHVSAERPSSANNSSGGVAPAAALDADTNYRLKSITFLDPRSNTPRRLKIVTQNLNGPCPLIAICNVLLLRGDIDFRPHQSSVSYDDLAQILGEYIAQRLSARSAQEPEQPLVNEQLQASNQDYWQNASMVLDLLPTLQTGLDVNIHFSSPFNFELTSALVVFDMFNITLCHGWTVDPQDIEAHHAVVEKCVSYNKLVEKIIEGDIAAGEVAANPEKGTSEQQKTVLETAAACRTFLSKTASQLTYHGLHELYARLPPNSLAVLFRNNHFSTLLKHVPPPNEELPAHSQPSGLFTLVTDQGFVDAPGVVWETFDNVEGDSDFVDGCFNKFSPGAAADLSMSASRDQQQQQPGSGVISLNDYIDVGDTGTPTNYFVDGNEQGGDDRDLALALALQEQERVNHEAYLVERAEREETDRQQVDGKPQTSKSPSSDSVSRKKKERCIVQ
ncbi:Ubiquitin carboxyl-terminal hydrolase MINDY-1 [Gaertneriomyces sp. JEL0708]|nr:Ubiquitin carboxyl-terminal hydrolase MINDY-1 [Gaertneriomyces sp. JEL0708]